MGFGCRHLWGTIYSAYSNWWEELYNMIIINYRRSASLKQDTNANQKSGGAWILKFIRGDQVGKPGSAGFVPVLPARRQFDRMEEANTFIYVGAEVWALNPQLRSLGPCRSHPVHCLAASVKWAAGPGDVWNNWNGLKMERNNTASDRSRHGDLYLKEKF